MPLDLVIFDMNDVLCVYDRSVRVATLATLAGTTPEAVDAAIFESGFEDASDRGEMDARSYLEGFGARLGYPVTRAEWAEALRRSLTPIPDSLAIAGRAAKAGARIAILTNNGALTMETLGEIFPEAARLFGPDAHGSSEFGAAKPNRRVYEGILALYHVEPQRAFFVDDKPAYVEAAEEVGIVGHVYSDPEALAAALRRHGLEI